MMKINSYLLLYIRIYYNDIEVSKIHLNAGACVLRLIINETSNNLKIKRLKIVK